MAERAPSNERLGKRLDQALTAEEHKEWAWKLWVRMDRDRSGEMEPEELICDEFQAVLRSILSPDTAGMQLATYARSEQNCRQVINYVLRIADTDQNGILDFKEFERFMRCLRNERKNPDLIFTMFDCDDDSKLTKEEFRGVYIYFLGHRPMNEDFDREWRRLDDDNQDIVTRKQFIKWLKKTKNPVFNQHSYGVQGVQADSLLHGANAGGGQLNKRNKKEIHRPAPGLLPKRRDKEPEYIPAWNERFATKDISEQNIAWRGNHLQKTWFSRVETLPELKRFYEIHIGFQKHRREVNKPGKDRHMYPPSAKSGARHLPKTRGEEGWLWEPRTMPILSTDHVDSMALPGANRHCLGGHAKDADGERLPWRDLTPRAVPKKSSSGSLLLRGPGLPPKWLAVGRSNPCEGCLLTFAGSASEARLRGGPLAGMHITM
jgi:Ca2+-binding EF-hand superfamily protein